MVTFPSIGRVLRIAAVAAFIGSAAASGALAHAHLDVAEPAVEASVNAEPREVVLTFTERLEPALSSIRVEDADGKQVDKGDSAVSAEDARILTVSLDDLAPGVYTVSWTVTSVDTHRTEGSYTFTVRS